MAVGPSFARPTTTTPTIARPIIVVPNDARPSARASTRAHPSGARPNAIGLSAHGRHGAHVFDPPSFDILESIPSFGPSLSMDGDHY